MILAPHDPSGFARWRATYDSAVTRPVIAIDEGGYALVWDRKSGQLVQAFTLEGFREIQG